MTRRHVNFDNGGQKALRVGDGKPPSWCITITPKDDFLSAWKLYVSSANIVNNNVYYVKGSEKQCGVCATTFQL